MIYFTFVIAVLVFLKNYTTSRTATPCITEYKFMKHKIFKSSSNYICHSIKSNTEIPHTLATRR